MIVVVVVLCLIFLLDNIVQPALDNMITLSAKDMVMYFLACINSVRDSPLTAIKLLHSLLKRFVNEEEYADEWAHNIHHLTKEGKPAVVEAIKHLEDHPNRTQKLALSQTLCDIAYDLGTHISR